MLSTLAAFFAIASVEWLGGELKLLLKTYPSLYEWKTARGIPNCHAGCLYQHSLQAESKTDLKTEWKTHKQDLRYLLYWVECLLLWVNLRLVLTLNSIGVGAELNLKLHHTKTGYISASSSTSFPIPSLAQPRTDNYCAGSKMILTALFLSIRYFVHRTEKISRHIYFFIFQATPRIVYWYLLGID
ncbi:hypothetical protein RJT34_06887 [Clitoria ternatea]|uniref:Uncharacterized protein n=1 Tax=Clitoria ternatea TaxID=43366 RepID=A0AAN9K597_CLITE